MEVMRNLYIATLDISLEKRPTCGIVLPKLDRLLAVSASEDGDSNFSSQVKRAAYDDLAKR